MIPQCRGCSSKYLDEKCLAADIYYGIFHTAQWEKVRLISFNILKTKLEIFYHHRTVPKLDPIDEGE